MSNSFCASRPSFSASRNASDTTIIEAPRIMLLQIFAAWPLPGAAGMHDGLAHRFQHRLRAFESRVGAADHEGERGGLRAGDAARDRRIDHGQSALSRAACATSRAVSTSMVEESISNVPARPLASTPLGAEIDLAHLLARRQHGDHDLGVRCRHRRPISPRVPPPAAKPFDRIFARVEARRPRGRP